MDRRATLAQPIEERARDAGIMSMLAVRRALRMWVKMWLGKLRKLIKVGLNKVRTFEEKLC
jgi:hypothetical protein